MAGCGDSLCWLERPKGQCTNGGCRCFDGVPTTTKIKIIDTLSELRKTIKKLVELACAADEHIHSIDENGEPIFIDCEICAKLSDGEVIKAMKEYGRK